MTQAELFGPSAVDLLIDRRAAAFKDELHAMVTRARREIGQMTRADLLRETIERDRRERRMEIARHIFNQHVRVTA